MIIPLFSNDKIEKDLQEFIEEKEIEATLAFASVGTDIVNEAKNKGTYHDYSSNLRSSIGFKVFWNGKEQFNLHYGENSKGVETGKSVAKSEKKGTDVQLVVVAGMEYAEKVEKRHEGGVLKNFIHEKKRQKDIENLLE